jgi:hypothetical protein
MRDTTPCKHDKTKEVAERVGFEPTSYIRAKEFCGALWPSKVLKGNRENSYCPFNAPKKFVRFSAS